MEKSTSHHGFNNNIAIFKHSQGVRRNPKHGKKKGGIKVHTVLKADEGVPHSIHFTSAATHDHVMLKKLNLSNGAFIAMDRAYIDYRVFEQFTKDGVFYITKMKKNQRFKQLKQNFPLKYFFGESVNAIQTQICVALIANLLLTVGKKRVKRDWSFSNLVTMIRQTLMYYIDLYQFCENPEKAWLHIIAQRSLSPPEPSLFD